jgi:hypothetical protein
MDYYYYYYYYYYYFDNLIIGEGGFELCMSPLETPEISIPVELQGSWYNNLFVINTMLIKYFKS